MSGLAAAGVVFATLLAVLAAAAPTHGASAQPPSVQFTAEEEAWLAAHPTVNLGNVEWAPISYTRADGSVAGTVGQVTDEFYRITGSQFVPVPGITWTASLEGIRDGTVDAVMAANASDYRRATYGMEFTEPWLTVQNNLVTKGVRTDITAQNLGEFRVVGIENFAINGWIRANHPGVALTEVPMYAGALMAAASGEADVLVDPWIVASH